MPSGTPVRSILLCGASVRSLAESAIAAGLRPLCVDFFEDVDLKTLLAHGRGRFVGRIESFADLPHVTHSVRSRIPLLWAGGLENHTGVLRAISRRRILIGADPDTIDHVRDPVRLRSCLSDSGLKVPRLATSSSAAADCQWLRKPFDGSGGMGIRRHEQSDVRQRNGQARNHLARDDDSTLADRLPQEIRETEFLQEYIDGVPMSAVCSVANGRLQLWGMSLQLIGWPGLGASDFLFCGNIGPVDPGEAVTQDVLAAAKAISDHMGVIGVFGIDFILREGRAWFLEVNPRLTASHMLFEQQIPGQLMREHLTAFGMALVTPRVARSRTREPEFVTARLILWAHSDFLVPGDLDSSLIHAAGRPVRIADVPKPGTTIRQASPICSVLVRAESLSAVADIIADLKPGRPAGMATSWDLVGAQCRLLQLRFKRNISLTLRDTITN